MTKGRNTTQEERAEIVAFCIEHGKDYGLTIETYNVSYQQIYSWVKKYEEKGVEGLTDRRGKTKPESELTEEERLRQENKILQAKIKETGNLEILNLLLSHEDDRVKINAASTCLQFNVYMNESIHVLNSIVANSDDETIRFSARMLLKNY